MRTFVPDRTCWSLLLTALAIRLRNKPMYNTLRVLIINKDVRKSLARKNGNENPIWSWNDSDPRLYIFWRYEDRDPPGTILVGNGFDAAR